MAGTPKDSFIGAEALSPNNKSYQTRFVWHGKDYEGKTAVRSRRWVRGMDVSGERNTGIRAHLWRANRDCFRRWFRIAAFRAPKERIKSRFVPLRPGILS